MKNTVQLHTASNIANAIVANALESGRLLGVNWPMEYEFAVVKRYSTWPLGWMPEVYVSFFETEEELKQSMADSEEWARCEDNHFARRVYRWDWGPVEMPEHAYNAYQVPTKLNSYDRVCCGDLWKANDAMNAHIANIRKAATPQEFTASYYELFKQDREVGSGRWPFTNIEKVPAPMLFIASTELKRIEDASKDVDENAPVVLKGAPSELDNDGNDYWY